MRIVCWQTILMKYHTLFFLKIKKDVTKSDICCSHDWRFKGYFFWFCLQAISTRSWIMSHLSSTTREANHLCPLKEMEDTKVGVSNIYTLLNTQ